MKQFNKRRDWHSPVKWNANWIHAGLTGTGVYYAWFFRKVELKDGVCSAQLYVTADKKYKLFIDDRYIGRGPLPSNTDYWSYDSYEVKEHLSEGTHTLRILVQQQNPGDYYKKKRPLALLCQLDISYDNDVHVSIGTDSRWKACRENGWMAETPKSFYDLDDMEFIEVFDAAQSVGEHCLMEYNSYTQDGARFIQVMDEDATMKTDTMGTYYLMDAARRMRVKHVVAITSYFVLGIGFRLSGTPYVPAYLPIDEEHPCAPEDSYSLAKLMDEEIIKAFTRAYGMSAVALRLLGVYYPDSEMHRKIYKFNVHVQEAADETSGYLISNTYQYVDARDVARAVELSIEAKGLQPFEAFFVATDTVYAEDTKDVIPKRWPGLKDMGRDIRGTDGIISIDKAKRLLNYTPEFSWRNGK